MGTSLTTLTLRPYALRANACGNAAERVVFRSMTLMFIGRSMATFSGFVPYCGAPPVPGAVSWNLDPTLLGVLAVGAGLYAWRSSVEPMISDRQRIAFYAGWIVVAAAMISPICNLGVALFSARIVQHMILALVAAPLLIIGGADELLMPHGNNSISGNGAPQRLEQSCAASIFALILWFWHLAGPYDASLHSNVVYWIMELSLLVSALWLWRVLMRIPADALGYGLTLCLFTTVQMCALGVLLAFSNHAWFEAHALTTWAWGLSPLEDQRLGGLIMWVPGGMVLAVYFVAMLAKQIGLSGNAGVAGCSRSRHQ